MRLSARCVPVRRVNASSPKYRSLASNLSGFRFSATATPAPLKRSRFGGAAFEGNSGFALAMLDEPTPDDSTSHLLTNAVEAPTSTSMLSVSHEDHADG